MQQYVISFHNKNSREFSYLEPPSASIFRPKVCLWRLRGTNFTNLEDLASVLFKQVPGMKLSSQVFPPSMTVRVASKVSYECLLSSGSLVNWGAGATLGFEGSWPKRKSLKNIFGIIDLWFFSFSGDRGPSCPLDTLCEIFVRQKVWWQT